MWPKSAIHVANQKRKNLGGLCTPQITQDHIDSKNHLAEFAIRNVSLHKKGLSHVCMEPQKSGMLSAAFWNSIYGLKDRGGAEETK